MLGRSAGAAHSVSSLISRGAMMVANVLVQCRSRAIERVPRDVHRGPITLVRISRADADTDLQFPSGVVERCPGVLMLASSRSRSWQDTDGRPAFTASDVRVC